MIAPLLDVVAPPFLCDVASPLREFNVPPEKYDCHFMLNPH